MQFGDGQSITATSGGSFGNGYLYYYDTDGDRYPPNGTLLKSASSSNTSGQVRGIYKVGTSPTDPSDCYDADPATTNAENAYPGQTSYYTTVRGDSSYDYDCDSGVETKQYTTIGTKRVCTWSGSCSETTAGVVGYETSAPACGASGTYYLSFGTVCTHPTRNIEAECISDNTVSESRTQSCR